MQIPDLDYSRAFGTYNAIRSILAPPVPFWWAGGSLIAMLRRVERVSDDPWSPWNVEDVDIGVHEADYPAVCAHFQRRGMGCLLESAGDGKIPSRINQGPSSMWTAPGLGKVDVMAFPAPIGEDMLAAPPTDNWLAMMDLNVCRVLVGPGVGGICLHAEVGTLRDIATGRVEVLARHPTTEARAEKYRRRLGGG